MPGYKQMFPLPTKSVTAGGNCVIELEGMTNLDARCEGILLELVGTGTAPSGQTQAVTPKTLATLLANIDLDSDWAFVRATGRLLHHLSKMMTGYSMGGDESVTITDAGVAVRGAYVLPFVDYRAENPFDTAIPCKLLQGKTLNISFASSLVLDMTQDVTMSNVTLRATALLVPASGAKLPAQQRIAYEDVNSASAHIQKPGDYTHMFVYSDSQEGATAAGVVTIAQFAQFTLGAGGQTILDRVLSQHLLANFNRRMMRDAGGDLSYQASVNLDFLPLLFPGDKYKLTQLVRGGGDVQVDIDSGTASSARYAYRSIIETDPALEIEGARQMGFDPQTTIVEASTKSKAGLEGSANRVDRNRKILPKRLKRA